MTSFAATELAMPTVTDERTDTLPRLILRPYNTTSKTVKVKDRQTITDMNYMDRTTPKLTSTNILQYM